MVLVRLVRLFSDSSISGGLTLEDNVVSVVGGIIDHRVGVKSFDD